MKAYRIVFTKPGVVELESIDIELPGPEQILIQTEATLLSPGTEGANLAALPNTPQKFPMGIGYSNVGIVLEVGANVKDFSPGDRVASHSPHASHALTRSNLAVAVPEGLSSEFASFSSLAAISMQAVRKTHIELGESVLIVGQGLVGNLALQIARLQGGYPVIGADLAQERLVRSLQVGADYIIKVEGENLPSETRLLTDGDGARVVIEATGNPGPIITAFQSASWCGRVVLLASTRGETEKVNFYQDIHKPGLTILGAHNSVRPQKDISPGFWPILDEVKLSLNLISAGRLQVAPLITNRLPSNKASEAYRLVSEKQAEALGIILDWKQ